MPTPFCITSKGDSLTYFQVICEDNKMITKEKPLVGSDILTFISQRFCSPLLFSSQCVIDCGNKSGKNFKYGKYIKDAFPFQG